MIVTRFSPDARYWLEPRLSDDPGGRLRELASTAPGYLLFAVSLTGVAERLTLVDEPEELLS